MSGRMWGAAALMALGGVAVMEAPPADAVVLTSNEVMALTQATCMFGAPVQERSAPYGTPIEVDLGANPRVRRVAVSLNRIAWPHRAVMRALLVSPDGRAVQLIRGAGGSFPTNGTVDFTFDDDAPTYIPAVNPPSGTYRPTVNDDYCSHQPEHLPAPAPQTTPYANALSAFNGIAANGTWRMYVSTTISTYTSPPDRTIGGWSLDLTPTAAPTCDDLGPIAVAHDTAISVPLTCVDGDGDPMTLAITQAPTHGTLTPIDTDDSVVYTPRAGFSGVDSFTYVATDIDGTSKAARVDLTVAAGPPAPTPPPVPPAAPAPTPAPEPPATTPAPERIVSLLAPPATTTLNRGNRRITRLIHRMRFDKAGRYTLIYIDTRTGKRLPLRRGSRIGTRVLARAASAPVSFTVAPNRAMVLAARFGPRVRSALVQLRVVLRRPDGTLAARTISADATAD